MCSLDKDPGAVKELLTLIQDYKGILPQIDDSCFIAPTSAVIGKVEIGKNSSVWYNAVLRGDAAAIVIGEESNIQDGCILHCMDDMDLKIGCRVTIGHGAILHSCTIGDGSLVGMGAIVLDGVKIGKNCLIGAGALVTPNTVIPDGSLVLGSPAVIKKQLGDAVIRKLAENAEEYVNYAAEYLKNDV